jgi:hypothetical protein
MTAEGAVVKACLEYLAVRGIYAWRNNSGALLNAKRRPVFFGKPGSADILGILPGGTFLAVECKAEKGKLSDRQIDFLKTIAENGGAAILARSVDGLIKGLNQFEEKQRQARTVSR